MTREEVEKIMRDEPKIQASFEVIGDDVKFIKLIVNGKEKVVSIEEIEKLCRETDDYENEIEDLHNRLDIAEYDKERLREEVTNLEGKIKVLEQEPTAKENLVVGDCISRKAVHILIHELEEALVYEKNYISRERDTTTIIEDILALPPVTPKPKTGHWEQFGNSWEDKFKCSECGNEQPKILCGERIIGHWSDFCPNCGADMTESEDKE